MLTADKAAEEKKGQANDVYTNQWGTQWSGASPNPTPSRHRRCVVKDKVYEEKVCGLWIKRLLNNHYWDVVWNKELPEEAKGYLAPYFIGPKYRPDLCLTITMENHCYQLLLMEVVSNEDIDLTIAECERSAKKS